MREGRSSLTAVLVAFGRGVGLGPARRDALAGGLLPAPLAGVLGALERAPVGSRALRLAARLLSFGLVDHATLRMAAVDAALIEGLAGGCDQLVIVGAGLDTRAWRMPELSAATVFEVDHPDSQAAKRARAPRAPPIARQLVFAQADLVHESFDVVLDDAGHRCDRPTLWLWEAVSPYLPPDAVEATLRVMGSRSTAGSGLVMTYVTPDMALLGRLARRAAVAGFRALGEPLVGLLRAETVAAQVEAAGFTLVLDSDSRDWARRFGGSATLARPLRGERLAVCVRRPDAG